MSHLDNYLALLTRVDQLCAATSERLEADISCRPGCDACCRHLSVFAVEAAAIKEALDAVSGPQAELIRKKASESGPDDPCPLLHQGLCLLYQARPIICRTHGLPLLITRDDQRTVDFCPENFRGLSSISGGDVIDLDRLNSLLTAINAVYLSAVPGPERVILAEILSHSKNQPYGGNRKNAAKL